MSTSEDRQGWAPSNTHPSNPRSVASCCDTLYLSLHGTIDGNVAKELERLRTKRREKELGKGKRSLPLADISISFGGLQFLLETPSPKGFHFRLECEDMTLLINPAPPAGTPSVHAQLRSVFLWRVGWKEAIRAVHQLGESIYRVPFRSCPVPQVSRADLCVDFQGWIPRQEDLDRFICRARYRQLHFDVTTCTGLTFGKGTIVARLYDKTREIVHSEKEWMRAAWESGEYDETAPVWRLEFQLRRQSLRELGISSAPDLLEKIADLWNYATEKWLRLTVRMQTSHKERWPMEPAWDSIRRSANFGDSVGELVRVRRQEHRMEHTLRGLVGNLSSFAALARTGTLEKTLATLEQVIEQRLFAKQVLFSDLVAAKTSRVGPVSPEEDALKSSSAELHIS